MTWLEELLKNYWDYLKEMICKIWDLVCVPFQWLINLINLLLNYIHLFISWINENLSKFSSFLSSPWFSPLHGSIPDWFISSMKVMNGFIDLQLMISCLIGIITMWISCFILKFFWNKLFFKS